MITSHTISIKPKTIGVLLSGGNSARMGINKLQLKLPSNQLLIDRQIELLERVVCELILISCKSKIILNNSKKINKYSSISDIKKLDGPTAGILSSILYLSKMLEIKKNFFVLFLPIDMPKLDVITLVHLLRPLKTNKYQAAIYKNHNLPLGIKVNDKLLEIVNTLVKNFQDKKIKNFSVWDFLQLLNYKTIKINEIDKNGLININTQEEWKEVFGQYPKNINKLL